MTTAIPSNYDFSDPAIRDLVDANHRPTEVTVTNVGKAPLDVDGGLGQRLGRCRSSRA